MDVISPLEAWGWGPVVIPELSQRREGEGNHNIHSTDGNDHTSSLSRTHTHKHNTVP